MKHGCSVRLPLVMYEPYINRESWMFRTHDLSVPEDREGGGNAGNLPR